MNKQIKKDRLVGKRIFVHKPGRAGYTNISVPQAQYDELLRLAHLDERELTTCARAVSWHARAVEGESWSAVVVDLMFKRLRGAHRPWLLSKVLEAREAETALERQADENNAGWAHAV